MESTGHSKGNPRIYEVVEHAPKTGGSTVWAWPQIIDWLKIAGQPVPGPWPPDQKPRPDPEAESLPVAVAEPTPSPSPVPVPTPAPSPSPTPAPTPAPTPEPSRGPMHPASGPDWPDLPSD